MVMQVPKGKQNSTLKKPALKQVLEANVSLLVLKIVDIVV